jgi:hypothetical protein
MAQLILGLGNKARHGKDSFAQAIIRYYANLDAARSKHGIAYKPTIIQHIAFADALYKEVNNFLQTYGGKEWAAGSKKEIRLGEQGILIPAWVTPDGVMQDPRAPLGKHTKLLQWWGTEFRRNNFGQNYWVDQWKAAVNPKADIVFSTDMRFSNEAQAVTDLGGFTVQVNRLNVDGSKFIDTSRDPLHVSETQLDGYNYDFKITIKTGDLVLLEDWAVTLVHYLRALKGT